MIRFESVSKRYPEGREALIDLTFTVEAGEMLFVTGHSGAGKTTLLKLIALIERASRGEDRIPDRLRLEPAAARSKCTAAISRA